MPIGEFIVESLGQLAVEAGGEAIYRKYGWVGCVATIAFIVGLIALIAWLA